MESAADSWWYTTLMPGGRRLLAYFTDADLAPLPDTPALVRLLHRAHHTAYTAEPRWPTHPFWSRRHTPPEPLTAATASPTG